MNASERRWAGWLTLLVALALLIPYTVLREQPFWYGAFLFWSLFALVVIASLVRMTRTWRD